MASIVHNYMQLVWILILPIEYTELSSYIVLVFTSLLRGVLLRLKRSIQSLLRYGKSSPSSLSTAADLITKCLSLRSLKNMIKLLMNSKNLMRLDFRNKLTTRNNLNSNLKRSKNGVISWRKTGKMRDKLGSNSKKSIIKTQRTMRKWCSFVSNSSLNSIICIQLIEISILNTSVHSRIFRRLCRKKRSFKINSKNF